MAFDNTLSCSNDVPSPLEYNPNFKAVEKTAPIPTFGRRLPSKYASNTGPGPAEYNVTLTQKQGIGSYFLSSKKSNEGATFSSYNHDETTDENPNVSPQSYNVTNYSIKESSCGHKIAERHVDANKNDNPSPFEYTPIVPKSKSNEFTLKGRNHSILSNENDTPGPGAYTITEKAKQQPMISIYANFKEKEVDNTPGPNFYSPQQSFGNVERAKSLNTVPHEEKVRNSNPGPGEYNIPTSLFKRSGFSIKFRHQQELKNDTPASNAYNVEETDTSGEYKYIHDRYHSSESRRDYPGVGSYNVEDSFNSLAAQKDAISFASKCTNTKLKKSLSPGPNEYYPKYSGVEKEPSIKIGKKFREFSRRKSRLGPAAYNTSRSIEKCFESVPAFHFRFKIKENIPDTPGPGAYEVDSTLKKTSCYIGRRERRIWKATE